jgi:adenine-specific DNA-methyltransferase
MNNKHYISNKYTPESNVVVYSGDCINLLATIPDNSIQLIVTSPPYNIGKEYEKRLKLHLYAEQQRAVITECIRVLSPEGSICWQIGNYVDNGSIIPLDMVLFPIFRDAGLKMRNRIIWRFEHGLHCAKRLSGRYETIIWFTKSDNYYFDLDPIRIPQKYPGKKYFRGPRTGQYSSNPKGKNPGDVWEIPNVKNNHVEKTEHPCQFPVELIERLVLSMTKEGDRVLDPFLGTGTSIIAAIRHNRKGLGAEIFDKYIDISVNRIKREFTGTLKTRPMNKPIYDPLKAGNKLTQSPWTNQNSLQQLTLGKDK